jgi:hypothetical protein
VHLEFVICLLEEQSVGQFTLNVTQIQTFLIEDFVEGILGLAMERGCDATWLQVHTKKAKQPTPWPCFSREYIYIYKYMGEDIILTHTHTPNSSDTLTFGFVYMQMAGWIVRMVWLVSYGTCSLGYFKI